ncbi:MAG TPA: hypothetical protein VI547_06105, partial [Anaerolineales bacterium]|nr:hypothetical protein [Anaerolineales bacterium]
MPRRFTFAFVALGLAASAAVLLISRSMPGLWPRPVISPDNAARVTAVALIGEQLSEVRQVVWSPDGKSLVIADGLGVSVYEAMTMERTRFIDPGLEVLSVAVFVSAAHTLAVGGAGTVQLWDMGKGELRRTLAVQIDPDYRVTAVAFSLDGQWAALSSNYTGTQTYRTQLLDLETGQVTRTLNGGGDDLAFSADSRMLASALIDAVEWWDTTTGQRVNFYISEIAPATVFFGAVAIDPRSLTLAGAAADDKVRLWQVSDQRPAKVLVDDSLPLPIGVSTYDVAFSPIDSKISFASS